MVNSVVQQHRAARQGPIGCLVLTISDTRTWANDRGGAELERLLVEAGHRVVRREIVPDEPDRIRQQLLSAGQDPEVEIALLTGGTGIGPRDQTYETVVHLLTRQLPGYGELFRQLSFQEIGAAAMLSRAVAGVCNGVVVVTMPGSPAAVTLAMERLILPELAHLVAQAQG